MPLVTRNIYGWYLGLGCVVMLLLFCFAFSLAGSTRRRREQVFLAIEKEYYEKGTEVQSAGEDASYGNNFTEKTTGVRVVSELAHARRVARGRSASWFVRAG